MDSTRKASIRDVAEVHVTHPVSGARRRHLSTLGHRSGRVQSLRMDPRVMAVVHRQAGPGTVLVFEDAATVLIVNRPVSVDRDA